MSLYVFNLDLKTLKRTRVPYSFWNTIPEFKGDIGKTFTTCKELITNLHQLNEAHEKGYTISEGQEDMPGLNHLDL